MKLLKFKPKSEHGGNRITIKKTSLGLNKIDSIQFLELRKDLKEPQHTNKIGSVACIVIDGWMEAEVNRKRFRLEKNQGILFEPGEKHRIVKGEGQMISISSNDYDSLGTVFE